MKGTKANITTDKLKGVEQEGLSSKERPKVSPQQQLDTISLAFLNTTVSKHAEIEMEAKFGTRGARPITKIDYDNVVKKLKASGWTCPYPNGTHLLRIQPEFLDVRTGKFKTSSDFDRFRIEIDGLNNIQDYCKTNSLNYLNDKNGFTVKINRKTPLKIFKDGKETNDTIQSANFDDFNFRVSISTEESVSKTSKIGVDVLENWNKTKKVFRYMNRVTFQHKDFPFKIDLSIVKMSTKNERGWMIQSYNIEESNVFNNQETYEMEIEVETSAKLHYKSPTELSNGLQKIVKIVLSGLQKTNYPISYPEQREVGQEYLKLLFEEEQRKKEGEYVPKKNVYPSDFLGPGLVTLDLINVAPLNKDVIVPNITEPHSYCVTEKADGDRHLLFVNGKGRIYLINTNMNIIFTGAKTEEEKCFNSLLDGELILHNKWDMFINTFAAFDIYYINNVDVRARPFINTHTKEERYFKDGCRLPMLKEFIKMLKPISVTNKVTGIKKLLQEYGGKSLSPMKIVSKKFYPNFDSAEGESTAIDKYNIFEANNYLLRRIADDDFEYEIDGLIFTPTLLGVGGNKILEAGPKKKITWPYIFKWKPTESTLTFPKSYLTIDFLVVTKKGSDGKDVVTPIFEDGVNNYEITQFNQYKTLILTVGFDPSRHGFVNPCQDVLDDKFSNKKDIDDEEGYKPKQFFPSDPYDPLAGICNVMLEMDSNGAYQLFTEERQVFDDQMVVEFRYDMTKPGMWKWVPMRVRYDKTAEFRAGNGVGANDYKTANSNWHSIHNPVTERMIATGEGIPGIEVSDDVYYNSVTTDKMTQRMRDFHNLYVKKALIQGVSKKGNNLIDFACGKAGDLPKWIGAELSFVFGIDISPDNIENRLNGACARYLNFKMTNKNVPYALFVTGNSSKNIRSGTNMFSDKANQITKSVFGSIGVDKSLGPAVARQHGKGHNGFDVSSCQFAIHYMFENKGTFYNFIRNIAECTKLYGYFIATCYDGRTIFNMLKRKQEGESREIYVDDKKVWSITKQYDATTFEDNESCLGYKIDVYQDSINQTLPEYLVNFDFLTSTMDKYGFTLVTREEARQMRLPEGSGMFSELFNAMENEVKRHPEKESDYKDALSMRDYEKDISFLNRFFIYKKTSTRNAEKLTKSLLDQLPGEEEIELAGTMLAREAVAKAEEIVKPKAKKLSGKLKLQEATEALEEAPKKTKTKTRKIKETEPVVVEELSTGDKEEIIEIAPVPKKKTTRRKKEVEFDIVEEK
jgi:SAM-dependent methyltransferase